MYRRSSLKFKKTSNFKARTERRVGAISNVLSQISTEVLFDSGSSDVDSLPSSQPFSHRGSQQHQIHQQPPTARTLPGEILLPTTKEEEVGESGAIEEVKTRKMSKRRPPNLKLIETKIVVEEVDSTSVTSTPFPHFDDDGATAGGGGTVASSISPLSAALSSSGKVSSTDNTSQMSFIIREKLHEFAKDLRRRTSAVRDEVIREPTPTDENEEDEMKSDRMEGGGGHRRRAPDQASLMSLIGLHHDADGDEIVASRLLPASIDTFSKFYVGWLSFVLVAFLYNAFVIPLRCSYPYQSRSNLRFWLFCDYTCDLVYLADLLLIKPRLTFMHDGITIREPAEMLQHYLASGVFKLDLLALLPLDLLYLVTGPISAWRLFRILKLPSFWEFFDLLDSSFSNPYAVRIAKTFCYMIYIIHCNSCVYYVLSAWQGFGQIPYNYKGKWYLNKWVYNNEGNAYIRCFYFTAAVGTLTKLKKIVQEVATSTGNNPAPTNVIEYIYMTFSWMMGVFVFALLLGQIRDIVSNANKNNEEFRTTMDKALSECKRLGLPDHLTARVRSWFLYTWEQQRTLDEKKLVEKLPLKLQTDLALSVHYNTLSKVKLFQDADRAFLRDLVLRLRPVIFLPGDMICRKGDVGKEMYIVNNGILEVVGGDNNEKVFATLAEGSVFGEISLLAIGGNNRRTANIRSKGYSTLFVLSKEDLNDVIKDFPDAQQLLKKKARQILRKDQKGAATAEEARKNLIERCRVSCDIRTPRMLAAVAKLLPPQSKTTKRLETVLNTEERPQKAFPHRLKRWSTIPDDFSDVSELDPYPRRQQRQPGTFGGEVKKRPTTSHSLK